MHDLGWLHFLNFERALGKQSVLCLVPMGVHVEQELKELREDVLLDRSSAVEQHVLAHLFAQVVLRVEALNCFLNDIHDALHWLRQESRGLRDRFVLNSERV